MENKYYTPGIEEFHVGFEYEEKGYSRKGEWTTLVLDSYDMKTRDSGAPGECAFPNTWDNIEEDIETGNIRVKHLDREDIESLRWVFVLEANQNLYAYKKEGYRLSFLRNLKSFIIHKTDGKGYIYKNKEMIGCPIFIGNIKNKSELKRLMQQLNVG